MLSLPCLSAWDGARKIERLCTTSCDSFQLKNKRNRVPSRQVLNEKYEKYTGGGGVPSATGWNSVKIASCTCRRLRCLECGGRRSQASMLTSISDARGRATCFISLEQSSFSLVAPISSLSSPGTSPSRPCQREFRHLQVLHERTWFIRCSIIVLPFVV